MIDRHHLLECILWPNGDGTFRKIVNTQKRLKALGAYDDRKMTIQIEHGAHSSMHHEFKKGTEYDFGENHTGSKNYRWVGDNIGPSGAYKRAKKLYESGDISEEEFQMCRDQLSAYRRENRVAKPRRDYTGSNNPRWKGDEVGPQGAYKRAKKLYNARKITEEEFQQYKDTWAEYQRERKATRSHT